MLMEITSAAGASSCPTVSSITLTYRGTWAVESAAIMLDIGLGREDMKIVSIRCLQGGLRAFRVHQRSTSVRNRHPPTRARELYSPSCKRGTWQLRPSYQTSPSALSE
ncbi:hypothetical protein MTO96_040658 [Rhipicephalus appendiculatus]